MDSIDGAKGGHVSSEESFTIACDPCDYDHTSNKAAAYCHECAEYLCEGCKTAHGKLKLTRSHKLLSGELMPPKRLAGKMQGLNTVLCSCMKHEVSIYCKEHCSLVCVNCRTLHHRRCKTSDIDEEILSFNVDNTKTTIDNFNALNKNISTLQESREHDLRTLSLGAENCRDRVKQFREELIAQLDSMEAKSLSDISILETQEQEPIVQQVNICKSAMNRLDDDNRNLQLAIERADTRSIFMCNIQLSHAVTSLTSITEEITTEVYQPHISFECSPAIIFAGNQDLGTVKCHTSRTPQLIGFDEMCIAAGNKINVKLQSDANGVWISGSTFLSSGELILCDCKNNKLKLLDKNLKMKESIDVSETPWDVAPVNQHQVIVTFPYEQYLQFIQVTPSLALGHKVDLGMQCCGVAVSSESIYISFIDSGECKIGIYDLTGKKKLMIGPYIYKDGKLLFKQPYYIDVLNDEKIFVSDVEYKSNTLTVYCLESNGNVLYSISYPSFNRCTGISVDENENLLVCDGRSHKVFLITKDGKEVREFLTEKDGLYQPFTTSFRRSDGTLMVGCEDRNDILVFTLK